MSLLADFIIATESEALEYCHNRDSIPHVDVFESTRITPLELTTLLALLNGVEWHEDLLDSFPTASSDSLTKVSDEFLDRLTDFDYDLDEIAAKWAATDEMLCEAEAAHGFIDALAQHAVRARRLRKPMYLWNCI